MAGHHQVKRSVDNYTDEFKDLIKMAGYSDGLVVIVKYRRGLNPDIQNQITHMMIGQPGDVSPDEWYNAASLCDKNRTTNVAFQST